jgi:hypothetical protein
MQSDILPPNFKRSNTNTPKNSPMRSVRLQGHSIDDARKRLSVAENSLPATSTKPEAQELVSFNESMRRRGLRAKLSQHLQGRTKFELLVLAVIVLLGGSGLIYTMAHFVKKPAGHVVLKQTPVKAVPPTPATTVASPLSGIQVQPQSAQRPVTGIMIENSPDARPQSGLQDAGVVYEAIAEAGITRFLAVFQDSRPGYIGPVRSLRPYYLDFATPYQASIAHVGGSPEALATVRNGHYRDIDQFFNSKYYTRIKSRTAPHNVYTNFDWLDQLNQSKGYNKSEYTPWKRIIDRSGHSSYVDTGSGAMKLFQDGAEVDGTWNKADQASMFSFKDSTGKEIALNAGQTWIVIVGSPANVSFSP